MPAGITGTERTAAIAADHGAQRSAQDVDGIDLGTGELADPLRFLRSRCARDRVVLVEDKACGGGLKVRNISPGQDVLPATAPGLPIALDSPGISPILKGKTVKITVPVQGAESINFDAVAAKLQVHGCSVCVDAEQHFAMALDPAAFDVEVVHLGTDKGRLPEAEAAGVKSVPALVIDGQPYHINFGADIAALR